jgi:hypothetical protein
LISLGSKSEIFRRRLGEADRRPTQPASSQIEQDYRAHRPSNQFGVPTTTNGEFAIFRLSGYRPPVTPTSTVLQPQSVKLGKESLRFSNDLSFQLILALFYSAILLFTLGGL